MTEQSRPKPIELVARAIYAAHPFNDNHDSINPGFDGMPEEWRTVLYDEAHAAFDILIKHGCISIEGIIARDEELARVAPVPERAGDE